MKRILFTGILFFMMIGLHAEANTEIAPPVIKQVDEILVVGINSLISENYNLIGFMWERLLQSHENIGNITDPNVGIGISYGFELIENAGNTNESLYYHLVGMPVSEVGALPQGMTWYRIPAGIYAVFTHKGSLAGLSATYNHIFSEWIPQAGYDYDPEKVDFEWYDSRFQDNDENSEFDIYVPVKEKL
ncbi:MAG: AraC family transcriptional regulator [Candidatus Cloacimonetes bacterium]|nr:AraC family transcriptional regulator [Candidatus Cloacimonadota bacterium]